MADFSSEMRPENELVELLWDNGQIVMQGQSNRAKKSLFSPVLDLEVETATLLKFGHSGAANPVVHNLPPMVPCRSLGMAVGEDETDPWMSYDIGDDSLHKGYCSELFSEFPGIQTSSLSYSSNGLLPLDRNNGGSLGIKDFGMFRFSQKPQPKVFGGDVNACKSNHLTQSDDIQSIRFQKQDGLQPSSSSAKMNFPHFSRPAALVKSCTVSACPAESNLVNQPKIDPSSCAKKHREDSSRESLKSQASSFTASKTTERKQAKTVPEAVVASSSVCSEHSFDAVSDDLKQKSKRRSRDEWGELSDGVEDESFAMKKPEAGQVASAKRSRAAEVHNLSERKRRDRINEKMKALQELIPNCNKVDKASMLEEAIEYLKTLQLQVQMMAMGTGMCIPPVMVPAGMNFQHMHLPPVPHFSPLGVGMGLGFGVGMIDLNGAPAFLPVASMHGAQFPSPSIGIPAQRFPASVPSRAAPATIPPQATVVNPTLPVSKKQQSANLEVAKKASSKDSSGR